MEIKSVVTGFLDENCYVLINNGKCLIIDPGDEYHKIKKIVDDNKVLGVRSNLEEKEYEIGDFKFQCIFTPGHSKDSVTFYFKDSNAMFDGDFIFKESIGRCDLPGGSEKEMKDSLRKILEYNNDIKLYPGHYQDTTLGYEKENNAFIKEMLIN